MEEKSFWDVGAKMTASWSAADWGQPPLIEERRAFVVGGVDTGFDVMVVQRVHLGGEWWRVTFEIVERTQADAE